MEVYWSTGQEEQDVLVGKTARQHKEADEKISKLKVKAFYLGRVLHGLGVTLAQYPELLSFDEESMDAIYDVRSNFSMKDAKEASPENIQNLCREIRQAIAERNRLAQELQSLGYGS